MDKGIELLGDADGFAVIGSPTDVERFLLDLRLDRVPTRELDMRRLNSVLGAGGDTLQVASELAANSGRWVKLTVESADAVKAYGLMASKTPGVSHAMIGQPGDIKQWLQIAQAPGTLLLGPMALPALAAMMQQRAMQQQMDEIVEYLQEISEKVDDVIRSQKDAVFSDLIGVDLDIDEALTVRDQVGRVSEVTWSKIQGAKTTIARTEAYAVRQLDAIAEKLRTKADAGGIAKTAKEAEGKVQEWLAVLARCFQLDDAVSALELDRVLDACPEEIDQHRLGLRAARRKRLDVIARSTARLLAEMDETVRKANSKVLFNPFKSPAAVRSSNQVATDLLVFRGRLGVESGHQELEARRWGQAATEVRDKVLTTTAEGADAARRFGSETYDHASEALRAVDIDGAGLAIKGAAADAADAIGTGANRASSAIGGLATGAASALGDLLRRKQSAVAASDDVEADTASERPESVDA
ncbi:MAG TPA: hypothetical protein VIL17_04190 [Coriobacteriia bacterium]